MWLPDNWYFCYWAQMWTSGIKMGAISYLQHSSSFDCFLGLLGYNDLCVLYIFVTFGNIVRNFFECFCIFIWIFRFTHCSTNHLRMTRTVLHQRLKHKSYSWCSRKNYNANSKPDGKFYRHLFSCHEWCCLSGLWALCSLNCCSFPPWLPSRAVKFQPEKKGRFELLWISKSVFSVARLASFVCESAGTPRATAISMLLAEQTGLLSPSPRKSLGAGVGRALLTNPALSCRVGESWTPPGSSASQFYENRSPPRAVVLLLCKRLFV